MNDINNALASNYLLVSHTINKWSGKKTDRKASDEIISGAHAVHNAGRFVKDALAGANNELKVASAALDAVRAYIYTNTLPYSSATSGSLKGDRLLPTMRSMEFIATVDKLAAEAELRCDEFAAVYDQRVQQAISNLGTLANQDDYPSKDAVRASFGFVADYTPVPSTADYARLQIPAELADKFAESMVEKERVIMDNALGDLRKRLLQEVERVAKTLGNHFERGGVKSPIGKNLINNVRTLIGILSDTSFTENPQLDKLVGAIEKRLCGHTVEQLRASPTLAGTVSKDAKKIITAIDGIEWF